MYWTNDYIKIPFGDKGRDRKSCDCWGLVRLIYRDRLGIELPELLDYSDTLDGKNISQLCRQEASSHWVSIPHGEEKPFDVIVLKVMGFPMHIGVVCANGFMIHCLKGSNTVVVPYNGVIWKKRIAGFYRYGNTSKIVTPV